MLYNNIPQTQRVTIPGRAHGPAVVFTSDRGSAAGIFYLAFGVRPAVMDRSNAGMALTNAQPAFHIINLISCAAAVYIYARAAGVQSVAVFHAHTGDIPANEGPMAPTYNVHGVPAANVYVVFASSQEMTANPRDENPGHATRFADSKAFTAGVPELPYQSRIRTKLVGRLIRARTVREGSNQATASTSMVKLADDRRPAVRSANGKWPGTRKQNAL